MEDWAERGDLINLSIEIRIKLEGKIRVMKTIKGGIWWAMDSNLIW